MSRRPLPPREDRDYSGIRDDEPEWIILCGVCAVSGFIMAAVILALAWWLS